MLLAIESSCDESSAAIFDTNSFLKSKISFKESLLAHSISSQIEIHQEYGGVVPEIASREHLINIPRVIDDVMSAAGITEQDLSGVAVTVGPGLKGCLLVGLSMAKGISMSLDIPLYPVNHLEGHIISALFSEKYDSRDPLFPAIAMLVSGGHTQLVNCREDCTYEVLATTMDDAAGEAFDKVGSLLGFSYPAGASVSKLAREGVEGKFKLPVAVPKDPAHFSFSGLKTAAQRLINLHKDELMESTQCKADISLALEEAIIKALIGKTDKYLSKVKNEKNNSPKNFILAGGVAANTSLRLEFEKLTSKYSMELLIPPLKYCTDNAAMIGAVACYRLEHGKYSSENMIQGSVVSKVGVGPRFPLDSI